MASIKEKSETTQGKSVPSGIPRSFQEEWGGRQVVYHLDADLGLDGLQPGDPDAGFFFALFGFLALVAGQFFFVLFHLAAVAVMGFIVDDNDILLVAQFPADPSHHLVGRFGEGTAVLLFQNILGQFPGCHAFALLESLEVGDDHLGLAQLGQQFGRDQVVQAVIVVGVVGEQHPQPVTDGDAGRDDQEGIREARILRVGQFVQGLPGDQHPHHQRLAGTGGHFEAIR